MRHPFAIALLSLLLAACVGDAPDGGGGGSGSGDGSGSGGGGGSGGDDGGGDDGGGDDGGGGGDDGGGDPGACPDGNLGAVPSLLEPEAVIEAADPNDPNGPKARFLFGGISEQAGFEIGLWDGFGAFQGGPAAPGSYSIAGADASAEECGICVFLYLGAEAQERIYMASSGSVTLDSVDGTLSGSASSLSFQEIDEATGAPVAGGCTASLASISFSAPLQQQEQ